MFSVIYRYIDCFGQQRYEVCGYIVDVNLFIRDVVQFVLCSV